MKRIFCADDDLGLQDVFPLILSRAGFEVTMFTNGEELLSSAIAPPDLFVLDKQLAGINGMQLCEALKKDVITSHIPVIIVSASPDLDKESKSSGADDYLEKPFKMKDLLALTKKYLGQAQD